MVHFFKLMKREMAIVALTALAAGACRADWETSLTPGLFSVSFDAYEAGEKLSDKGAAGGTWGTSAVPEDAEATAVVEGGRAYMNYSTSSTGLVFTPNDAAKRNGPKFVKTRWLSTGASELPLMEEGVDKAGFSIYTPSQGAASFVGWSEQGWQKLHLASGALTAATNTWYDVAIWLVRNFENKVQVQYRLNVGGEYEPLQTAAGATWLDAGAQDDAVAHEVEARGIGALENLAGKELPNPGVSVHFR